MSCFCGKTGHPELEGVPWGPGLFRDCWLYANDAHYRAIMDNVPRPPGPPAVYAARPVSEWPRLARTAAFFRGGRDRGLGDTVAACLHFFGADGLARFYTALTGRPCNCADKQEALNLLYSYPPE